MTDVVWLASYPRSGNTWLRFMLSGYFFGRSESSIEVNGRIADIHREPQIDWDRDGTVLLKTHFQLRPGHPGFERTAAFVFILRDPRDVLLSNFSYLRMVGALGETTLEDFARDFIANFGPEHWRVTAIGDWVTHATYWLDQQRTPGLVVRYEELRQRPFETLSTIVSFLGEEPDGERIAIALESGQISKMRDLEEREKKAGAPTIFTGPFEELNEGRRFVNTGETRRSLASIDAALETEFDRVFAPEVRRLEELAQGIPRSWQRRFPMIPSIG